MVQTCLYTFMPGGQDSRWIIGSQRLRQALLTGMVPGSPASSAARVPLDGPELGPCGLRCSESRAESARMLQVQLLALSHASLALLQNIMIKLVLQHQQSGALKYMQNMQTMVPLMDMSISFCTWKRVDNLHIILHILHIVLYVVLHILHINTHNSLCVGRLGQGGPGLAMPEIQVGYRRNFT
jgi:hypothetical protein